MNEKWRPLLMLTIVAFALPMGETVVLRRRPEPFAIYTVIDGVLITYAVYWWYFLDRKQRGFRTGTLQNVGIVLFPPIALPVYFIRSRGWLRGVAATLVMLVIFVALAYLGLLGEMLGSRIAL